MGRAKFALGVTTDERRELEAIAASRSLPHGLVRRARMILWSDEGLDDTGDCPTHAGNASGGLELAQALWPGAGGGLHDALKSGPPRTHGDERIAQLLNAALLCRPAVGTHWTVRGLADETGVAKSSVQRYLKLFGVQPHRSKTFKLSTDPFFVEKVRDIRSRPLSGSGATLNLALLLNRPGIRGGCLV